MGSPERASEDQQVKQVWRGRELWLVDRKASFFASANLQGEWSSGWGSSSHPSGTARLELAKGLMMSWLLAGETDGL